MSYQATTATHKLLKLRKRIKVVAGGTSAGKTISILQILIDKAQSDETPTLTSVVSESFPHLRRGAMRDFLNIMQDTSRGTSYWDYYGADAWSKTEFTYTFPLLDSETGKPVIDDNGKTVPGSKIEFFSADQPSKVRGPRRDRLFINECNNVPYEAFDQLEVRTRSDIWLDFNPTSEFWYYSDVAHTRDHDFITLTYQDNGALDPQIVESIEAHRANKAWWQVYGLGQLGEVEGKIFTDWQIIDEIPHEARLERRGLDFGYSNDPTALVDIYSYNGGIILDEQLYQKGLSNKQIADFISNLPSPKTLVVADSSEPKSIDELSSYGVVVLPANKGQGSVLQGIQKLQDQRVSITKRSTNGIKEYRNYMWMSDKDGRIINTPIDLWNHFLDATRYGNESLKPTNGTPHVNKAAWVQKVKASRGRR